MPREIDCPEIHYGPSNCDDDEMSEDYYWDKKIIKLNEIISTQETYINNTLISDSDKVESKIKKLREDRKELIENIKYFVDRVEDGTIRSKKTYAIYTNLLSRMKETE